MALITIIHYKSTADEEAWVCGITMSSLYQDPLASSLYELIQHHGHISQNETAYVEAEELGGVAGG